MGTVRRLVTSTGESKNKVYTISQIFLMMVMVSTVTCLLWMKIIRCTAVRKSRLLPKKYVSIARLELTAATLLVKMSDAEEIVKQQDVKEAFLKGFWSFL